MPSTQSYLIAAKGIFVGSDFFNLEQAFPGLDLRSDPMVKAGLCAQIIALQKSNFKPDEKTATIGLTTKGCLSHLQKVVEAAAKNRSRTGFFVRSGPQTLASYSAMAHHSHGPTFSLMAENMLLANLFALVDTLLYQKWAATIHLTFSDYDQKTGFKAGSLFLQRAIKNQGWSLPTVLKLATIEEKFLHFIDLIGEESHDDDALVSSGRK